MSDIDARLQNLILLAIADQSALEAIAARWEKISYDELKIAAIEVGVIRNEADRQTVRLRDNAETLRRETELSALTLDNTRYNLNILVTLIDEIRTRRAARR